MRLFPRGVRLRTQIVLLQVALVALTLGLAFGVFAYLSDQRLTAEYGQRALAIARTVASDPVVRAEVARYAALPLTPGPALRAELADGELEQTAEAARQRTDALFVVITDDAGLRLAHPDPARLGEKVSTDPSQALGGAEVVISEHGTLGDSVRAKVPVREPGSEQVVGEVSVGISTEAVGEQLTRDLSKAGVLVLGALFAGIAGSVLLARRWHGLTLGLQPAELAELVREQDVVLHGIGVGVVAVDDRWRTTVINDEARTLLGIEGDSGRPVETIGLTPRVLAAFRAADGQPVQAAVGDRIVVVTARTVTRDGRSLGAVLDVRDRTDVESLTRQLDAVQSMSTVLRAQRHEFANRLHLLSGLLHGDRPGEAARYIDELLGSGPLGAAMPGIDAVRDPYLQAFLAAKAAHARENGVQLRLGPSTWVDANLAAPVDVTTVLGNLLDNAIDAVRRAAEARRGSSAQPDGESIDLAATSVAVVEVELVQEGSTLHITVADSGGGVAPELVDAVFADGVSTKPGVGVPGGRGVGLALSRQVARALGGDVWLASAGMPDGELTGAEFIARLPGVLTEGEPT
ncbi:ATP-binding protein [Nocardia rhizosphaerihabitans]|uniref:histidine kinase n=1 Tax=Nocardia rhizosphaerihabitans TaxID=1691570 RepID=A0ABQ2K6J3_9NOCA|nr:ATP-binding protein [Nocardia rhizosphaerihabitans]GGN69864.1 histidine kinase [Nocardia rhizosphaerihabitans]